jgi:hypothetical protein
MLRSTNLKKENDVFSAINWAIDESGSGALYEKKGISDATKGL